MAPLSNPRCQHIHSQYRSAGLPPAQGDVLAFVAGRLQQGGLDQAAIRRLQARGLGEADICELALAAAVNARLGRLLQALGGRSVGLRASLAKSLQHALRAARPGREWRA